jgi:hypothetical protein
MSAAEETSPAGNRAKVAVTRRNANVLKFQNQVRKAMLVEVMPQQPHKGTVPVIELPVPVR